MFKSLALLLALVSVAVSTPFLADDNAQVAFESLPQSYPGFDLDLNEVRLVQLEGQPPVQMTELDKIKLRAQGVDFFDVTETQDLGATAHLRLAQKASFPTPSKGDLIKPILKTLSTKNLEANLRKFSSFRTRYYRSDTGKQSQQWLASKLAEITEAYAPEALQSKISITEFAHSFPQSSVILRINGSDPTDDSVIVIAAHQDSTNTWPFLPAPGADDDGSGSITIVESYQALIAANFTPIHAVEFHWYAAEESGLLGSQAVAQDYERRGINVTAVSHFDMTAWVKHGTREEVGLVTDFVDLDLTDFSKQLIDAYLDIPWVETQCGYACSDHASWTKAGYPSSFSIESTFENSAQHVHTTRDTIDISDEFSFNHMQEFSKLAVAFAVELGGWSQ
ncbi:peptidase [Amylocystis lapponica]|nr:peptidase [Amylocystis lapponica]